ncbi:hypothetical protein GYMLUDRAFT_435002 [Collybiopsis luxurians FD-317 M1]|uniref:Uncharacterized protein n=1 Tax=Collybiopsis luxurians FD-317 M1 TaxID=944289 RepID=A0A0D0D493_9AGAR|nr:hypothetical protein GYMLUDRAFT_435002 [Collybiopsis luxurians FD-317 M1]
MPATVVLIIEQGVQTSARTMRLSKRSGASLPGGEIFGLVVVGIAGLITVLGALWYLVGRDARKKAQASRINPLRPSPYTLRPAWPPESPPSPGNTAPALPSESQRQQDPENITPYTLRPAWPTTSTVVPYNLKPEWNDEEGKQVSVLRRL